MKHIMNLLWAAALLSMLGCHAGKPITESNLAIAESTKQRIVFRAEVRKGDCLRVTFGEQAQSISSQPKEDMAGTLMIEGSGKGLKITGDFFAHDNPIPEEVTLGDNVKEEGGRFKVGTYTQWGVKNIPIFVSLTKD